MSEKGKPTPGPAWTWRPLGPEREPFKVAALYVSDVEAGIFHQAEWSIKTEVRNLTEAAPQMYAALRALVAAEDKFVRESGQIWVDDVTEAVDAARAALLKAEGSSHSEVK